MHRGYVKLWRCVEDTGLMGQPSAFYLYTYLLLKATHKPKSFVVGGAVFDLQPGQVIVGRNKLADDTGLSVQQIRTALELLKKLSIISCKVTNKCTVISINNWDTYQNQQPAPNQQDNQQVNQRLTNDQPAPNQHLTTIQEYKNVRIEECKKNTTYPPKGDSVAKEEYSDEFEMFWREYPNKNSGKKKAYSSFKTAMKKTKLADIMKSLDAHKRLSQWTKDGGAYIPYATTWLNGERWTVELEPEYKTSDRWAGAI